MDIEYLQAQRYKLQKRFRRLNSARWQTYYPTLLYFWQFVRDHELFGSVIAELESREPEAVDAVEAIVEEGEALQGDTEQEAAAIGLGLLKHCAEGDDPRAWIRITQQYRVGTNGDERARYFTEALIEPLYEYLDEQVDDRAAVLALIRRYKQRCEWFERERLFEIWEEDTRRGEARLAMDLYRYLHDQGHNFFIEPRSASGRADLIDAQMGQDRLLADAKIFNPEKSKGRGYLASGVKQLYTYCVDFQQPIGYLVIFKTSDEDLRFVLSREDSRVPRLVYNHKTLFLIQVDIFPYEEGASERGRLEPYEVTEEHFLDEFEVAE